jgi:hypothetical protein
MLIYRRIIPGFCKRLKSKTLFPDLAAFQDNDPLPTALEPADSAPVNICILEIVDGAISADLSH